MLLHTTSRVYYMLIHVAEQYTYSSYYMLVLAVVVVLVHTYSQSVSTYILLLHVSTYLLPQSMCMYTQSYHVGRWQLQYSPCTHAVVYSMQQQQQCTSNSTLLLIACVCIHTYAMLVRWVSHVVTPLLVVVYTCCQHVAEQCTHSLTTCQYLLLPLTCMSNYEYMHAVVLQYFTFFHRVCVCIHTYAMLVRWVSHVVTPLLVVVYTCCQHVAEQCTHSLTTCQYLLLPLICMSNYEYMHVGVAVLHYTIILLLHVGSSQQIVVYHTSTPLTPLLREQWFCTSPHLDR